MKDQDIVTVRMLVKVPMFNRGEKRGVPWHQAKAWLAMDPPVCEIVSDLDAITEVQIRIQTLDRQIPGLQKAATVAEQRLAAASEARTTLAAQLTELEAGRSTEAPPVLAPDWVEPDLTADQLTILNAYPEAQRPNIEASIRADVREAMETGTLPELTERFKLTARDIQAQAMNLEVKTPAPTPPAVPELATPAAAETTPVVEAPAVPELVEAPVETKPKKPRT